MADLEAYLQRLVDLAGDIDGIALAGSEFPDELDGNLPFVFIKEGPASYQRIDENTVRVTREYTANLYAEEFKDDNIEEELAARAVARPFVSSYPLHFMARSRLQRGDQGLNGIYNATVTNDGGIASASRKLKTYSGADFRHILVYDETVTEI